MRRTRVAAPRALYDPRAPRAFHLPAAAALLFLTRVKNYRGECAAEWTGEGEEFPLLLGGHFLRESRGIGIFGRVNVLLLLPHSVSRQSGGLGE